MAVEVRKKEAEKYLKKAEEFYESALENYQKGRHIASIFDASQAVILANDAYCIFFLGKRASKNHREAVLLHVKARSGENKKETVKLALELRSKFGYTGVIGGKKQANQMLVKARRFIDWVERRIGYV